MINNFIDDLICKETDSHIGSDLINAAQSGNTERVNTILSKESVNPDKKKRYTERGALHLACGYGQTSVIKELLEVNIDMYISTSMCITMSIKITINIIMILKMGVII